jgi:dihydrofolate synthase/folylpolyglutamate synthase
VLSNLISINYKQLHFIFGTVNDKDVSKILELLPKNAHYYFTKANIPRALSEDELLEKAKKINLKGKSYTSVKVALEAAKKSYKKNDLILIGGSTFLVGDALAEEKNN